MTRKTPKQSGLFPRLAELAAHLKTKKHSILIVEDNPTVSLVLQQRLDAFHQDVISAPTLAKAEEILGENDISLMLLDLELPDGDGRELLLKMRENPATSMIPIFVVSSKKAAEVQTECFALGADAFFQKPFDPLTLSAAVASRLQKAITLAGQTSIIDPLTQLPNRIAFTNAFTRTMMLASRSSDPVTVAILDVDRFKSVNDLYGHVLGDEVLRRLASVAGKSLRASDLLARWGGEEFVVLFPNTDLGEARIALDKALKAFSAESFMAQDGRVFHVTFSAGVARARPGASAQRAVANADRFLYLAKESGRDQVLTERDKVSLQKNILLVEDDEVTSAVLRRYLERDGFKVIHAAEGEAALEACGGPISLITLDVKMPGTDGFELLQRFRKIPALHEVPIVMLTSLGKQEDILRGFELGADDYIVKPFSPRELLARLHRLLQKK